MEVVVSGGHVIVGLSKKWIAHPWLAMWSRVEMVVGGHVHECMSSLAGHEQKYCLGVVVVGVVVVVVGVIVVVVVVVVVVGVGVVGVAVVVAI